MMAFNSLSLSLSLIQAPARQSEVRSLRPREEHLVMYRNDERGTHRGTDTWHSTRRKRENTQVHMSLYAPTTVPEMLVKNANW